MKVEQLLEHMDNHIKLLTDSVEVSLSLDKSEVKEWYGSIQIYKECLNMERGALNAMISLREWIVNKHAVEKHQLQTISYEQLLEKSLENLNN